MCTSPKYFVVFWFNYAAKYSKERVPLTFALDSTRFFARDQIWDAISEPVFSSVYSQLLNNRKEMRSIFSSEKRRRRRYDTWDLSLSWIKLQAHGAKEISDPTLSQTLDLQFQQSIVFIHSRNHQNVEIWVVSSQRFVFPNSRLLRLNANARVCEIMWICSNQRSKN